MNETYHIIFAGDDKYIKFIATTITSIVRNTDQSKTILDYRSSEENPINSTDTPQTTKKEAYVFHILTDGIIEETANKLKILEKELSDIFPITVEVHTISKEDFYGFPTLRNNYLTYFRLKLINIFQNLPEKVLYLDGDIIVNCDIRELFALDLKDNILAAALDAQRKREFYAYDGSAPSIHNSTYFNAGVMLINVNKWKEEQIEEKVFSFLNKYMVINHDQDALNIVVDKFILLERKWNLPASSCYLDNETIKELTPNDEKWIEIIKKSEKNKIIHYIARKKPWVSNGLEVYDGNVDLYKVPYFTYWWYIAKQTPAFKNDILALQQSAEYKKKVGKEEKIIEWYNKDSFLFKLYSYNQKFKNASAPYRRKLEAPFKKIRNKIRMKYKMNTSK